MMKISQYAGLLAIVGLLSACNTVEDNAYSFEEVETNTFEHLHGLGYINGWSEVVISTHDGLYAYGEDGWKEATSEKHDYMGFQAIRDGFFSSGHPEPGSSYKNPLGLIKSTDKGASFKQLAFYGEIDFHYMAVGYDSNAIYVFNEMPTNEMSQGFHYSIDEGTTWQQPAMNGFTAESISNLAAHPTRQEVIAIGSEDGVFLSENYGEDFTLVHDTAMITYVTLTEAGGLYANFANEEVKITSFAVDGNEERDIPVTTKQPIAYIAVNPDNQQELVIATYNNDIYLTTDEGSTWETLADSGELAN
ncbi:F510_1955 family glycosylhydrolase [Sporosarcina sp. NPDC096371]|uniref:F510_1955 family glycosylhydrolase n=1 Tax=Sporosarcina sp. NPDC096371 TaxID=3364530 RepID=UPI003801442F